MRCVSVSQPVSSASASASSCVVLCSQENPHQLQVAYKLSKVDRANISDQLSSAQVGLHFALSYVSGSLTRILLQSEDRDEDRLQLFVPAAFVPFLSIDQVAWV